MSQSPTPWCTDHVLPGLAYDGADGRYGNTATAIGSDSEKKLSSERQGKVIIYPFCWVYHLDLGSISHIDPRSSTLTRTEHFQWQNQVVRILHCITLKVNGFVTEKTCPQERLGPQSWEIIYARRWRMHMPCLECAKLLQDNKSRYEGGAKIVWERRNNEWKWNTLSLNNQVPGKHSTGAELFSHDHRVLAHLAGTRHWIGSLALAPLWNP